MELRKNGPFMSGKWSIYVRKMDHLCPEKWTIYVRKMVHFIHGKMVHFIHPVKWSILYTGATCRDEEQEQPREVPPWHISMHQPHWFTFKWMINFHISKKATMSVLAQKKRFPHCFISCQQYICPGILFPTSTSFLSTVSIPLPDGIPCCARSPWPEKWTILYTGKMVHLCPEKWSIYVRKNGPFMSGKMVHLCPEKLSIYVRKIVHLCPEKWTIYVRKMDHLCPGK